MLIKGLGRVEGTVEDLQPVTLKQLIPRLMQSMLWWRWGRIMMSRAIQMIYR